MKMTRLPIICSLALALATPSFAAVTLIDTGFAFTGDDQSSYTFSSGDLGNLDFTGASKLVFTVGNRRLDDVDGTNDITSITYGGQTLNLAATDGTAAIRSSIYYLDLDGVSFTGSDLTVSFGDVQTGIGVSALVLGNTVAGFGDTAVSSSSDISLTSDTDGSFAAFSFARNNNPGGDEIGVTRIYSANPGVGLRSYYSTDPLDEGSHDFTMTQMNGTGRLVGAVFAPVPEPTTALLGSLGMLFLLRRRR